MATFASPEATQQSTAVGETLNFTQTKSRRLRSDPKGTDHSQDTTFRASFDHGEDGLDTRAKENALARKHANFLKRAIEAVDVSVIEDIRAHMTVRVDGARSGPIDIGPPDDDLEETAIFETQAHLHATTRSVSVVQAAAEAAAADRRRPKPEA